MLNNFYRVVTAILVALTLFGCNKPSVITVKPTATKDYLTNIKESTKNIDSLTSEQPEVFVETNSIRKNVEKVSEDFNQLDDTIEKLVTENAKLNDEVDKWYKKTVMLILIASALGAGISIVLFLLGKLPSLLISGICVGAFISSIALLGVSQYFTEILIGTGVIFSGLVAYVVYGVAKSKRANKEFVATINKALEDGILDKVELKSVADAIQSNSTQAMVKAFQKELEKKNDISISK